MLQRLAAVCWHFQNSLLVSHRRFSRRGGRSNGVNKLDRVEALVHRVLNDSTLWIYREKPGHDRGSRLPRPVRGGDTCGSGRTARRSIESYNNLYHVGPFPLAKAKWRASENVITT